MTTLKFMKGAGPIDGHGEDDDMRLIVAWCDLYCEDQDVEIPSKFWQAVHRRTPLLRRVAKRFKMRGRSLRLMPPTTLRTCASYLLSN